MAAPTIVAPAAGSDRRRLFALHIDYLVPLAQIDALLPAHVEYLDRFYADGTFLLSGRRVPRTGGFILAAGASRSSIETITAQDPFVLHEAARYQIIEVAPTKASPDIRTVLEQRGVWS